MYVGSNYAYITNLYLAVIVYLLAFVVFAENITRYIDRLVDRILSDQRKKETQHAGKDS